MNLMSRQYTKNMSKHCTKNEFSIKDFFIFCAVNCVEKESNTQPPSLKYNFCNSGQ